MNGLLVVGVGNPDRGDDAAGILTARRVLGCRVVECTGSLTALLDLFTGADHVILIDAVAGSQPGRVHRLSAAEVERSRGCENSSHGFGVGAAIGLARALGTLPRHLTVYAIEGNRFELGEPPSRAVTAAAVQLSRRIGRQCRGRSSLRRARRSPRHRSTAAPHAA